jgi:AcrR family transcriptional regulator
MAAGSHVPGQCATLFASREPVPIDALSGSTARINDVAVQHRRARERALRHQLIVKTARELAETDGWDAVTTRRLADRIEYSQPVLYSHFANRDAIVEAVAVEGFAELAAKLADARHQASGPAEVLASVARAYLDFGLASPALYDAMFTLSSHLSFGKPEAPEPLHAAFAELRTAVAPLAGNRHLDTFTEVFWSSLHGLVSLTRAGRLRDSQAEQRLPMFVALLLAPPPAAVGPRRRASSHSRRSDT